MRFSSLLTPLALTLACGAEPAQKPAQAPPQPSAASTAPTTATPVSVRRVIVSQTRRSGSLVTTRAADGTLTVALDVLLNGRGPHVDATLRLASDGTIAKLDAHGHHEMGAPVDETFSLEQGHARWKSHEEQGDRALAGPAFFMPISEVPEILGLLAQALLKAGGSLPLLPAGEAKIEKVGEATVHAGDKAKHLGAYAITGLELTPTRVWMEDDGSWFGYIDPWFSIVPEGWQSAIEPLVEKQRAFDREREALVAKQLTHRPPAAGLALTHARVLDVAAGKWLSDQTVVVVGDVIRGVGPAKTAKIPEGAETIDLGGKALLPGLWDMHAHLSPPTGALDIASGVTTVRDVGSDPDQLDDMKQRYDEGSAIGPRVFRMGFIEGRGEKAAPSKITAENEAEAKAAVEFYAKRGYDGIKIYNSVKPELVPLLAKDAHARGMLVTGHIPMHMLASDAVRAGYDGIEHINMLFLNFFADHDTDTRTTLRFSLVAEKADGLDLASKPVRDFFALLQQHHTVIDPTLDAFEDLLTGQQGKVTPGLEPMAARLPVQVARYFLQGGLPQAGKEELYRRSYAKLLAMVRELRAAQIQVVAGTDMLAGLMLHHELELFVRAGISPADALRMATIEPARVMKQDKKSGSVAAGKLADLVIVDGDPLARISDLDNVVTTLRGGIVFPSKELYETVGVRPKGSAP